MVIFVHCSLGHFWKAQTSNVKTTKNGANTPWLECLWCNWIERKGSDLMHICRKGGLLLFIASNSCWLVFCSSCRTSCSTNKDNFLNKATSQVTIIKHHQTCVYFSIRFLVRSRNITITHQGFERAERFSPPEPFWGSSKPSTSSEGVAVKEMKEVVPVDSLAWNRGGLRFWL